MDKAANKIAEQAYPINADMEEVQMLSIIDARKILAKWINEVSQKKAVDFAIKVLGDFQIYPNAGLENTYNEWINQEENNG